MKRFVKGSKGILRWTFTNYRKGVLSGAKETCKRRFTGESSDILMKI